MGTLGSILGGIGGLIVLVCHIIVIVKMFQRGKTGLGILAIVLTCCGVGAIFTLIYGWVKSTEWNIKNLMIAYSIGWVLGIAGGAMNPGQITVIQQQFQK